MEYALLISSLLSARFVQGVAARLAHGASVHGSVSGQPFYFHEFPTYPSIMATVMYTITTTENSPIFDIYTGDSEPSAKRQCSSRTFGQLGNFELHRTLSRAQDGCPFILNSSEILQCSGEIKILDYMPRIFAFSLGFPCGKSGLLNVSFSVTLVDQRNITECIPINGNGFCSLFYAHTLFPSLVGDSSMTDVETKVGLSHLFLSNPEEASGCYQHDLHAMCLIILPSCDHNASSILPLCSEACKEGIDACSHGVKPHIGNGQKLGLLDMLNCDYLPSNKNGQVPCFYEEITCGPPPRVQGAHLVLTTSEKVSKNLGTENFTLHSEVSYFCTEPFQTVGNNTIRCEHSGNWSQPPQCAQKLSSKGLLTKILLPITSVLLVVVVYMSEAPVVML